MSYKTLLINITASATWTALKEELTDTNYTPAAGMQAQIGNYTIENLSTANNVVVELAVCTSSGAIVDKHQILGTGLDLAAEYVGEEDDARKLIHAGYYLFAKATGTTPNATIRATILEEALS